MGAPLVLVGTKDGIHPVAGGTRAPLGHEMHALRRGAGGWWAISDYQSIWWHPDDGAGEVAAQLTGERANCLLPLTDGVLIGAGRANLYELRAGTLSRLEAFDRVPGRDRWYTPWGGPPDVRSMAAGSGGGWYVNVHVGGVVVSEDQGATWRDTMDIDTDVHEVIADPKRPGHAYVAAAIGLGVTTDGARSWEFHTEGLHASYCRAVALSAETVFVSAALGSRGRQAALYRRPRGTSQPFTRCTTGLPEWFSTNVDTFCLAARDSFVAAGDADGTVYVSDDDGATWAVAAAGLPPIRCLALG